jgi:copper chaperone NosL
MTRRVPSFICLLLFTGLTAPLLSQQEMTMRVTYDSSRCDYCRMLFQEKKFGGELQTASDSILVFDASECQAAYVIGGKISLSNIKKQWSVNYRNPGFLVDANKAWYVHSDKLMSPMEANIAAFASKQEADSVRSKLGGELMDWNGVVHFIRVRWFQKK